MFEILYICCLFSGTVQTFDMHVDKELNKTNLRIFVKLINIIMER